MKLVLKIAAGVFLGLAAAALAYTLIDNWQKQAKFRTFVQQQKDEEARRHPR